MSQSSDPKIVRKPYRAPELTVYGPIRELTLKGTGDVHSDHHNKTESFYT